MVALYLVGTKHNTEQFLAVLCSITQGCCYQFRCFVCSNGKTYRVIDTRVKHYLHHQTVVISCYTAPFAVCLCVLIQELHSPTIKRPHQEWSCRATAFHLHTLVVSEIRHAKSAGCRYKVRFFTPHTNSRCCYRLPTFCFRNGIVSLCYKSIVKVIVVCHKSGKQTLFFVAIHLCAVLIKELLTDKALITHVQVLIKLAL